MATLRRMVLIAAFTMPAISGCEKRPGTGPSSPAASAPTKGSATPTAAPAKGPATPIELAQLYAAMIGEGRAAEAIDRCIDFEALTDRAFPRPEHDLAPDDRSQIASMLRDMMTAPYVDPTMSAMMRSARFYGFEALPSRDGVTVVAFTVHYEPPDGQRMSNALHVAAAADGTLRAVDADTGRGMSMAKMMGTLSKSAGQKPLEFVRDLHNMALDRLKEAGGSLPGAPAKK